MKGPNTSLVLASVALPRTASTWPRYRLRRYPQGRISKRGSHLLHKMLNQAAWIAVRWNKHLRSVDLRIRCGVAARRKSAIVAVMRKLLVTA